MADGVGKDITWIITLFFLGALGVLAIMNAKSFATVGGTIFGGINQLGQTLSGTGYKKAK